VPAGGFFILADTLTPLLASVHVLERAQDKMEELSTEITAYAQANAPWEDRTGDAREGLHSEVEIDGDEVVLSLEHTVDYGLWLEVIQNGRFAIIMPTLEHFAGKVMRETGATETGEDD
jgi:hypothetical protein